jgi:flavin-dependent dehydrogenase
MDCDVAIAGAGPAGLAFAILAARRGYSTIVLERSALPRDKACGEGLMPRGVEQLRALGVTSRLQPADAHPFHGIRYVQEDGSSAEARFPHGAPGLGIRRVALADAMLAEARASGAMVRERCMVHGFETDPTGVSIALEGTSLRARLLVAADGLGSPLRRAAGLEAPAPGPRRFGLRQHFRLRPWSDLVEVHFAPGLEAYVTPAGAERVGIAFLWEDGRLPGPINFPALLDRFPSLTDLLGSAPPDSDPRGAGPLERVARARTADRFALLGDAAGYVDALTGEGLSLAFTCAAALAESLPAILANGAHRESLAAYERAVARAYTPYLRLAKLMLAIARRPPLRRAVVRALGLAPLVFDGLLGVLTEVWQPPKQRRP